MPLPKRDPKRPIPAPIHTGAPRPGPSLPPPRRRAATSAQDLDPTRLLGRDEDLGLDRRSRPRANEHEFLERGAPLHGNARLVAATHRPLRAVLGLRSPLGWAIVQTLSLAPSGILIRLMDLMSPPRDPALRAEAMRTHAALAPVLGTGRGARRGSPLSNLSAHLGARRVVENMSAWASPGGRKAPPASPDDLDVDLVVPARNPSGSRRELARIGGRLIPMCDPDPEILAVALAPARLEQLQLCLSASSPRGAAPRAPR